MNGTGSCLEQLTIDILGNIILNCTPGPICKATSDSCYKQIIIDTSAAVILENSMQFQPLN